MYAAPCVHQYGVVVQHGAAFGRNPGLLGFGVPIAVSRTPSTNIKRKSVSPKSGPSHCARRTGTGMVLRIVLCRYNTPREAHLYMC